MFYFRPNDKGNTNKKTHDDAKTVCSNAGGRLYEPASKDQFDKVLVEWVNARNKKANGWFGVEKNNANKWVYTTTKDEVDNAVQDWSTGFPKTDATGKSCAYFLGADGTWKNDEDCSTETENFLCEF